jgi:hypothetical protein
VRLGGIILFACDQLSGPNDKNKTARIIKASRGKDEAMNTKEAMSFLRSITTIPPAFDAALEWNALTKQTVKRFARGNIAAQNAQILLPSEQDEERQRARSVALGWKRRYAAAR